LEDTLLRDFWEKIYWGGKSRFWVRFFIISFLFFLWIPFGCRPKDPMLREEFEDHFDREALGEKYYDTIGRYRIVDGRLNIEKAYNHPLWLRVRLPHDVVVELEVMSRTSDGDIKVELFGDGRSHAWSRGSYKATGYVFCMGAWKNSKSFIARKDEHGKEGRDIVSRSDAEAKVRVDRTYHWKIVRKEKEIKWYVDGELFLSFMDPAPLYGPKNDHFGFNNWQSDVYFDNLKIQPLK